MEFENLSYEETGETGMITEVERLAERMKTLKSGVFMKDGRLRKYADVLRSLVQLQDSLMKQGPLQYDDMFADMRSLHTVDDMIRNILVRLSDLFDPESREIVEGILGRLRMPYADLEAIERGC